VTFHYLRHRSFFIAAAAGAAVLVLALLLGWLLPHTLGANTFFLAYSALILAEMRGMTPAYLKHNARDADLPVFLIFLITLAIVGAALVSLFELINASSERRSIELFFAMLSVPLGWFTIQAMAAMHYAHLYWSSDGTGNDTGSGLDFPGDAEPGGHDFLYFAATIGMTAQTADVAITTTAMRRAMLVHAIVSFFFNAVILAAAVNIVVTLRN